jgi:outer membrane cobalamin receptor
MLQETRGEGTLVPRKFMRSEVKAVAHVNKRFGKSDKLFDVTIRFRNDNTSRKAEENVRAVDLSTQIFSVGVEYEFWENWDLMLGVQQIKFNGFDYTAVRNNFSEIYNFKEYQTDGNEYMQAAGVRYRFSDKSSLSVNLSNFKNTDAFDATQNYSVRQFMLLYQMNF